MKEVLDAVYENGVLRPLKKLTLPEGRRIRVIVESQHDETVSEPSTEGEVSHDLKSNSKGVPPYLKVQDVLKGCKGALSEDISLAREDRL